MRSGTEMYMVDRERTVALRGLLGHGDWLEREESR